MAVPNLHKLNFNFFKIRFLNSLNKKTSKRTINYLLLEATAANLINR